MRSSVDPQKIEQLMEALGREARGSGCIYFTGGVSALLIGWRGSTVDLLHESRGRSKFKIENSGNEVKS